MLAEVDSRALACQDREFEASFRKQIGDTI